MKEKKDIRIISGVIISRGETINIVNHKGTIVRVNTIRVTKFIIIHF